MSGEPLPRRLGDLTAHAARRWGPREALVFGERRWTFAEVEAEVERTARALVALGVEPGDRVAIWLVNRPEWLFLFFGLARVGATSVPLNTRFRADDLRFVVGHSGARLLVQHDVSGPVDFLAMTREVVQGLDDEGRPHDPAFPGLERVVTVGAARQPGAAWWDDVLAAGEAVDPAVVAARAEAVDPEGTAMILYTSGTTGFPKGVMHSHRCIRSLRDRADRLQVTEDDVFLCYLPLFHLYALSEMGALFPLTGSRLVLTEGFDPDESVGLIERERATMLHGFDVHFAALMEARARTGADVSSLRLSSIPAGMESSVPVARRIPGDFCPVVSAYGLTEGWCCVCVGAPGDTVEQVAEASGFPMPETEVRVVDPATGDDQPVGTPGAILVRGFMVTPGYYREPELTAQTIDAAGWLHTGDMGYFRPDGHLRFLGRYKDMLKVGGENVSPMEVEGYLLERHPLVLAAVVGHPDERLGEVPIAFVVPQPGCALAPEELERAIVESCRGRIASFKIPRRVVVLDELPMTASGKIQKHRLRDLAHELLDQPPGAGPGA